MNPLFLLLSVCLQAALQNGTSQSNYSMPEECHQVLESHPSSLKVESSTGKYEVVGQAHMMYINQTLHSGDQTKLNNIQKIQIYETIKKVLVLNQEKNSYSLLTINLDRPGNVAPVRYFESKKLKDISGMKLLTEQKEIVFYSKSSIWFINQDADKRYETSEFYKTQILRELKGPKTLLENPMDVSIGLDNNIYVQDSGRTIIFAHGSYGNVSPLEVRK